ncbi:MAG: tRNA 2-thiouridine(34) synthase MnmA, partial [Candidatus Omnitrophica bacterium]|nr:tRNA 2-thiouridine(34) synthase MnmA [Candidatus Omnitrophota bacterium]
MVKKVLVAMSGGVDSSVATLLLKETGYDATGVTMCLGVKSHDGKARCCGPQAIDDAKKVCHKLGIHHYVMDFSKELEEKVVSRFVSEYLKGKTPNPCVDCNRFLKFGLLLRKAIGMGFDFLATGHYAKIEKNNGKLVLKKAKDKSKDQSYFLYPIQKETLNLILFPLAGLTKQEVRQIAKRANLPVADKPQSQDICFIQDDYRKFILERVSNIKPGPIVDLDGNIRGMHRGLFFYTVGQREKLGISNSTPLYVVSVDGSKNQVIVGEK